MQKNLLLKKAKETQKKFWVLKNPNIWMSIKNINNINVFPLFNQSIE